MRSGDLNLTKNSPVDLSLYTSKEYDPGPVWRRVVWYTLSLMFLESALPFPSSMKVVILRMLGAKVGKGVVIKPAVKVKYPWFLNIGDHVWIGERVWIDNLAWVTLGDHSCISQDAYLLTGNHDYKDPAFGLMVGEISIGKGAWIGARAVVCPGLTVGVGAVLCAGSVGVGDLENMMVYQGNPAVLVRKRIVNS